MSSLFDEMMDESLKKDQKIADLEAKLAESEKNVEFVKHERDANGASYISACKELTRLKNELSAKVDYIHELVEVKDDYKQQLAEKEKELKYKTAECEKWKTDYENCSKLEKLMTKEHLYCLDNWRASEQDKIEFAIAELEKLLDKTQTLDILHQSGHYINQKKVNVVFKGEIDQLIKELEEKKRV